MQRTRLKTFRQSRVVAVVDVVAVRRVRVGVDSWLSQLVQRTQLEIFRQSRVVVIVDVNVVVVVIFVRAKDGSGSHSELLSRMDGTG